MQLPTLFLHVFFDSKNRVGSCIVGGILRDTVNGNGNEIGMVSLLAISALNTVHGGSFPPSGHSATAIILKYVLRADIAKRKSPRFDPWGDRWRQRSQIFFWASSKVVIQ